LVRQRPHLGGDLAPLRPRQGPHDTPVSIPTSIPDLPLFLHLEAEVATLYADSSGEPLFKRGWRQDTGDAPLKETLAAAMLAAALGPADRYSNRAVRFYLQIFDGAFVPQGTRGVHSEHMGYLVAEMQSLARNHPQGVW
jgi:hypothetical protein